MPKTYPERVYHLGESSAAISRISGSRNASRPLLLIGGVSLRCWRFLGAYQAEAAKRPPFRAKRRKLKHKRAIQGSENAASRRERAEADARTGRAYRETCAIINVPFTSAESVVDTRRARRQRRRRSERSRVADAPRVPASIAVCFARAGGNESLR